MCIVESVYVRLSEKLQNRPRAQYPQDPNPCSHVLEVVAYFSDCIVYRYQDTVGTITLSTTQMTPKSLSTAVRLTGMDFDLLDCLRGV